MPKIKVAELESPLVLEPGELFALVQVKTHAEANKIPMQKILDGYPIGRDPRHQAVVMRVPFSVVFSIEVLSDVISFRHLSVGVGHKEIVPGPTICDPLLEIFGFDKRFDEVHKFTQYLPVAGVNTMQFYENVEGNVKNLKHVVVRKGPPLLSPN